MIYPFSFFIALRYWKSKHTDAFGRLITKLSSLGIALGLMALIIVLSVMNGLTISQKSQRLSTLPHMLVFPRDGYLSLSQFPQDAEQILTQHLGVKKVVPINQAQVLLQSSYALNTAQMIGIRHFQDTPQLVSLYGQNFADFLPQKRFYFLISETLAHRLNVKVGDKVRVTLTEHSQYTPVGQMPVSRMFTVSGIFSRQANGESEQVFTNLADIGRLMSIPSNHIQGYRLFLDDPFNISDIQGKLKHPQWQIHDWREVRGEFFQAVKMEKNMMGLLVSLIIVVAIANILTSLSLMVLDKQREIAILRTMGVSRPDIWKIFIWQGVLVGLTGAFFGAGLGITIALNLEHLLALFAPHLYLPSHVDWGQVVVIFFTAVGLVLLSTLYPAYRAGRVAPAYALRDE